MVVERREEQGLLRAAFADCVAGKGRLVLISGGMACGKTALLHSFGEHAAGRGALLLSASGARDERELRMGVMWQLFRSAALAPEVLQRVHRLVDAAPSPGDDHDAEPAPMRPVDARAVHGLCAVLLDLAKDRPVVLAIDDLQFVDAATLQVLLYMRRRMRTERVMLLLTEWYRPSMARPFLRAEVTRQPDQRISLDLLSENGVRELATEGLDAGRAARLAAGLHETSGGNPALARALVEDCDRLDPQARRPVIGGAFRQTVLDCLHRWDSSFLRVAGGLAVLGAHVGTELLAELLRLRPQQVNQVLDVLSAAGIADGQRLRNDEIAATVLGSLPPDEAAALHVGAAELLDKYGIDPAAAAAHLVAADAVPGPWAVRALRHAAAQAVADDPAFAVKCLELAIKTTGDEADRATLRAALVRVAWRVNPSIAVRHLAPLHEALDAGRLGWRDAVAVIRHSLWQGDLDAAITRLSAMAASAGPLDARTTAELRLTCEWVYGSLRERLPDDVYPLLTSTDRAPSANPWVQTARLNAAWSRGAGREVVNCAEHILQGCVGDVPAEVGMTALLALEHTDRQERALYWSGALAEEAEGRQATTWQALLGCVCADLAYRRGDLVTAHARATAALAMLPTQSWGVLIGYPLSILVLVDTAMGKLDEAAKLLDRPVPEAMFDTAFGPRYLHARGHHNLAAGRTLAALEDFERSAAWARTHGLDVPATVPWRGDIAQTLLRLGRQKEAKVLVTAQLAKGEASGGLRNRGTAMRVLAACSEPKERVGLLRDSAHHLERCGDRLELAKTLADLGQVHQELGQLASARLVLRKAEQLGKACQADVLAVEEIRIPVHRVPREATPDEPPSGGIAALSEAERKVAELAAYGYANREIGRKLYITVSTVEQHLTRVYKKLNVMRRTDLLSELSRYDAVGVDLVPDDTHMAVSRRSTPG
ncbi:helix-turn-helix transcriptional regulator [Labedaea rhizosphaerae]|uniref:ATP/maltotriose-dependent transcriptional regulator MalT n=1 Tax=Labedaea rhizosphaerae TaxID=598644 RepID=A0A4R6S2H7_LABRH|nr:AAA family ATPase [Labedaea rhizosphaerae]TDP92865.1 ATP/maltotriose-dependent transcriptional regulator MalT [Labedaea rhizosphaerae]